MYTKKIYTHAHTYKHTHTHIHSRTHAHMHRHTHTQYVWTEKKIINKRLMKMHDNKDEIIKTALVKLEPKLLSTFKLHSDFRFCCYYYCYIFCQLTKQWTRYGVLLYIDIYIYMSVYEWGDLNV